MTTIRLTAAQALVRAMVAQRVEIDGQGVPLFAGVWAIFGHGNVAGLGEALYAARAELPTYRGHNEQGMALAAAAYAKASRRRRMMACTTSIGPGALNMVTAAAVAHVDRLPVLLLPGDVFASRRPDPVLQQIEAFGDGTISANDCFRPVSRYFDRLTRPEQVVAAFERAMQVLTDPAECGPVTLAFCQDVQTQAADYPARFFEPRVWRRRRVRPDQRELADAAALLRGAKRPLVVAGGGVLYAEAEAELARFCAAHGLPVGETQAGKSSLPASHPMNMGGIGVTGTGAANALAAEADVILAVGTRLQDFTSGSRALFAAAGHRIVGLNVQLFDAAKHGGAPLLGDALAGLEGLEAALAGWQAPAGWTGRARAEKSAWEELATRYTAASNTALPSDAQVIGAVQRQLQPGDVVLNAAGGLPGELHKLFRTEEPLGYHMEYGFSCMGYEIAGGIGTKLALPDRNVIVMVGDGSYLMLNSELATSVLLGQKLTVVVLDNHGFGCINRLQRATGGESFNNLLPDTLHAELPALDFAAHARGLGAIAETVAGIAELEAALARARASTRTHVIVIETDAIASTEAGGAWWEVAVPEVSARPQVAEARARYEEATARRAAID
jgi:3D-(3,5/4)-trihydroxycyclohexane-1,2-dione acylhydrolase (decyclizing)